MRFSDFCDALDIPNHYCTQDELYAAYMREMAQFSHKLTRGPSFVMYPGELRSDIWYYYVAYLTLWRQREILTNQSDRRKYKGLLNEHGARRPGYLEKVFLSVASYLIAFGVLEVLILLWKGLRWLWEYFF